PRGPVSTGWCAGRRAGDLDGRSAHHEDHEQGGAGTRRRPRWGVRPGGGAGGGPTRVRPWAGVPFRPRKALPDPMIRTKIVCTLGPASSSAGVIERLVGAGLGMARINMSHG